MQIVEIKNNLLKIAFEPQSEKLVLAGFVSVSKGDLRFIAQVIHIEVQKGFHYAILKLIFKSDANGLSLYDGSAVHAMSELKKLTFAQVMGSVQTLEPLSLGEVNFEHFQYNVDFNFLRKNLLVCVEHQDEKETFINNMVSQVNNNGASSVVFDLTGTLPYSHKLVAGKDFKLPLNYETINFIYEKGLTDVSGETKAFIQEIFLEVQEYVKQIPEKFIPFENFRDVVDSQYEETQLTELVLLKNKLLKFYENGVFAQNQADFDVLKEHLYNNNLTVIDVSNFKGAIQREVIAYTYSVLKETETEYYSFIEITDENTDKKLLKQIFTTENVHSEIIAPYRYKYLKEIKQLSKNLVLFTPIQQQDDFAGYNVFLSRLNHNEFIVYGEETRYIPCLITQKQLEQQIDETSFETAEVEETAVNEEDSVQPEIHQEETEFIEPEQYEQPQYSEGNSEVQEGVQEIEEVQSEPEHLQSPFIGEAVNPSFNTDEDTIEGQEEYVEQSQLAEHEETVNQTIMNNLDEMQSTPASDILMQDDGALTDDDLDFIEENIVYPEEQNSYEQGYEQNDAQAYKMTEEQPAYQEEVSLQIDEEVQSEQGYSEPEFNQDEYQEVREQDYAQQEEYTQDAGEEEGGYQPQTETQIPQQHETPIVPVYPAEQPQESLSGDTFEEGDNVMHEKYGKGVVAKLIQYGGKTLCNIIFEESGKKLLDPAITTLKKI